MDEHDEAYERRLRTAVVAAARELQADPSKEVSLEEMRAVIARMHADRLTGS